MDSIGDIIFHSECVGRGKPELIQLRFENASDLLVRGFKYFIGDAFRWQPEYGKVAEWMTNNDGKGLLMYGGCGRGKSVIGEQILPPLLEWRYRWYLHIYSYKDMNKSLDEIKRCRLVYLDDIGQETVGKDYGNTIYSFADIVDNCEKKGNMLIASTNLTMSQLKDKYGERVISRLRGLCKPVGFVGDDLRWAKDDK